MDIPPIDERHLFSGLRELAESAFPKHCRNCGRSYASAEEFIRATAPPRGHTSGFKQGWDDDERAIVELFRNCVCGSTLMGCFDDRRDTSERGLQRRMKFGELLDYLTERGMALDLARAELLKVARGQPSELIARLTGKPAPP